MPGRGSAAGGPGQLVLSPDGHGGMLAAMARSGCLKTHRRRGIEQLFYFQVDNPLVEVCGEECIGYHLLCGAEMTSQVVAKREPLEKVGNVVELDGRPVVIEYSDLPDDVARSAPRTVRWRFGRGASPSTSSTWRFWSESAASAEALPFHAAYKKAACLDAAGRRVQPQTPNAVKFERFIFDLMPSAARAIVVEVDPARAFAPLKNASGAKDDTPESVKAQMSALHRDWLRAAGVETSDGATVEINPLFAMDAEELAGRVRPGTRVTQATCFS